MIIPSVFHIAVWVLFAALGFTIAFFPSALNLWKIFAGIGIGAALLDGLLCLRRPALQLKRTVHHSLPVTAWCEIRLKITSNARFPLVVEVYDHCDPDFRVRGLPGSFTLAPGRTGEFTYQAFPTKRGHYVFAGADIFVKSPLHLWQKKWFVPYGDEAKVFPNFREISHFALLATHHHLSLMGIKKVIRRGEGKEFHQLREYRLGDDLQKIDWKATSRYRRLISKEYQDERDQQIIFVLDCGLRMRHAESGKSHLDQALNSILLLAYVAARQGDGVGLYSFGGTRKWLPPKRQEDSIRTLLLGMYDIESSTNAADYVTATQDLLALQNRRSLMVIITNSRAEDYDDLLKMTKQLRRKHLVVVADLREKTLDENLALPISGRKAAIRYQSLQHYLAERKKLQKQLQHLGIFTIDVTADQLPPALVNRYLEIKSSGIL